ncbi:unnamed protein product [Cunninghamella echinulata]
MMERITTEYKKVRLVIIDYAGLSTNPDDIRDFIKKYKNIKELVVDCGDKINVINRYDLLHCPTVAKNFRCRKGSIKRSI